MEEIGDRLKKLINSAGITAYEVSDATGISQATLSRILNKNSKPNIKNSNMLSEYFNISKTWLLTGEGEMIKEEKSNTYGFENSNNVVSELNTSSYSNEIVIFLRDKIKLLEAQIVLLEENKAFQQEKILALERCVKCFQEEIKKLNNEIESSKK